MNDADTTPKNTRKTNANAGKLAFTEKVDDSNYQITVTVEDLSPRDAEKLLEMNTDNRNLRRAKVDGYRRAMESGRFLFNGDAIRISSSNVLLDGQHRLEALRSIGEAERQRHNPPLDELPDEPKIKMVVARGLPAVARETIDVGAQRTAANLLEFGDDRLKNAVNLAALGRAAMIMEHPSQSMPEKPEVVQYVHRNREGLEAAYAIGHKAVEGSPLRGGTTPYSLAAWEIGKVEKDEEMIKIFFRRLASGEGLFSGDPVLTLRNRLIAQPPSTEGGSRSRYLRNTALFLKAWNAFATGESMRQIRPWQDGQTYPKPVPVTDKQRKALIEREKDEEQGMVLDPFQGNASA